MSRYRRLSKDRRYTIAYGFDTMPMGGYYFQCFDTLAISKTNEEGIILNDGFCPGIGKEKMLGHLESIEKWGIKTDPTIEKQKLLVALDLPI